MVGKLKTVAGLGAVLGLVGALGFTILSWAMEEDVSAGGGTLLNIGVLFGVVFVISVVLFWAAFVLQAGQKFGEKKP